MAKKAMKKRTTTKFNISQEDLTKVLHLRREIKALKAQQAELTAVEKEISAHLIGRIDVGVPVENGVLSARVHVEERRIPAWKQICVQNLGEAYVAKVIEATPVSIYPRLVIE